MFSIFWYGFHFTFFLKIPRVISSHCIQWRDRNVGIDLSVGKGQRGGLIVYSQLYLPYIFIRFCSVALHINGYFYVQLFNSAINIIRYMCVYTNPCHFFNTFDFVLSITCVFLSLRWSCLYTCNLLETNLFNKNI